MAKGSIGEGMAGDITPGPNGGVYVGTNYVAPSGIKGITVGNGSDEDSKTIGQIQNAQNYANAPSWQTQDLSPTNPLPWQKYVDENPTVGTVSDSINRAKDPSQYENTLNYGLSNKPISGYESNLGMQGTDPMVGALNEKYQRDVGDKVQGIKSQNAANQPAYESGELGKAGKVVSAIQNNALTNFKEQYQFQMQRYNLYQQWQAQQNGAIGSFIGGAIGIASIAA